MATAKKKLKAVVGNATEHVMFRVTPDAKLAYLAAAKTDGFSSLSEWLRILAHKRMMEIADGRK